MFWYASFAVLLYFFGWNFFTRGLFGITIIIACDHFFASLETIRLLFRFMKLYFSNENSKEVLVNKGMAG